tara:strand:+ start:933 stop:1700 length:768 start_codon:yes stop_codon:yes gene_type:complete
VLKKVELERLLRSKNLGNTLLSNSYIDYREKVQLASTGIDALDGALDGGLPKGELSEIVGLRSSGRMSVLCAAMAAATSRGELVGLIDTLDTFAPGSAVTSGIKLSHLLWIRGHPDTHGEDEAHALGRALKALGLLLNAGGFGIVALDLTDLSERTLSRIPFTTWMRLPRAIKGQPTVCVLMGNRSVARSAGGVTLNLQKAEDAVRWSGNIGHGSLLRGLEVTVRVTGARRPNDGRAFKLFISADAMHSSSLSGS